MSSWFSRLGNKVENILPSFDEFDAKEEGQSITLPPSKAQHILEPPKPPHLLPSYQNALLPKKNNKNENTGDDEEYDPEPLTDLEKCQKKIGELEEELQTFEQVKKKSECIFPNTNGLSKKGKR